MHGSGPVVSDASQGMAFLTCFLTKALSLFCRCRSAGGEGAFLLVPEVTSFRSSLSWESPFVPQMIILLLPPSQGFRVLSVHIISEDLINLFCIFLDTGQVVYLLPQFFNLAAQLYLSRACRVLFLYRHQCFNIQSQDLSMDLQVIIHILNCKTAFPSKWKYSGKYLLGK